MLSPRASAILARVFREEALLDVGSGAGHWVDWFSRTLPGIEEVVACDVSAKACSFLRQKYVHSNVTVQHAGAETVTLEQKFDVVSILGCAFHIVSDAVLLDFLRRVELQPNGIVFANDDLPLRTHANQFDQKGRAY